MGRKTDRIFELQREIARLNLALTLEAERAAALAAENERLKAERKPSLADAARREFHARWDWLLEAAGL